MKENLDDKMKGIVLKDKEKYLVKTPNDRREVLKTISDVSEEYDFEFLLSSDFPFDLDTFPELNSEILEALRDKGINLKRYEYWRKGGFKATFKTETFIYNKSQKHYYGNGNYAN